MGISHLLPTLEKLSRPITASFPQDDTHHRPAAVIDGSALAHHVLALYLKTISKENRTSSIIGFDYDAYGRRVIAWLDAVSVGFEIIAIYTDAHLPSYKTTTRLSRIQSTVNNISRLRTLSNSLVEFANLGPWIPTFLIAGFCDAIRKDGRWSNVLKNVPGEADAFCAATAFTFPATSVSGNSSNSASGGGQDGRVEVVIFTSDSDLMVYPTNSTTRIAILNDTIFENTVTSGRAVKLSLWNPYAIEQRLGSTDTERRMVKFAWCFLTDSIKAMSIINGKARHLKKVTVPSDFAVQYTLPPSLTPSQNLPMIYDSRAGEVVYSSPLYSHLTHPRISHGDNKEVAVYLPVLLEDMIKSSAWSIGRKIRVAAYRHLFPKDTVIKEVHRKASGVGYTIIPLSEEEYDTDLSEFTLSSGENTEGEIDINPLLSKLVLEIVSDYDDRNSNLPRVDILALLAAITINPDDVGEAEWKEIRVNRWTWFRAHLWAQLLAGVWSLYLLHTTLSLALVDTDTAFVGPERGRYSVERLKEQLQRVARLVEVVDAGRFMAVYSLVPEKRQKGGTKKGRKRVKLDDGITGAVEQVFGDVGWRVVQKVLEVVEERRREREREEEEDWLEDGEGGEMYMGMTVG
ncbi:hypothetical protein AA313_de0203188 [Arthrobotrys entomopaga]|nr:hypothetical protein AA313_de0203188 [Arthrobotrys entomopaga]